MEKKKSDFKSNVGGGLLPCDGGEGEGEEDDDARRIEQVDRAWPEDLIEIDGHAKEEAEKEEEQGDGAIEEALHDNDLQDDEPWIELGIVEPRHWPPCPTRYSNEKEKVGWTKRKIAAQKTQGKA